MTDNIKEILISYKQLDFKERLIDLHISTAGTPMFGEANNIKEAVEDIFTGVCDGGDEKIAEFTEKFDRVKLTPKQFRVSKEDLKKAYKEINPVLLESIRQVIKNVRNYQEEIFTGKSILGKIKYTPIERVGICAPGASAPLPSTVIMTAVPAQVAGVKELAVVSPPRYNGTIHPVILATCYELGIDEVYRIGGAQAVAALAYGTGYIDKVDKIAGPGNQWVQTAKQLAFGIVGIDSIAGPSEVLIIANDNANPAWVAADMLSQAEHAPGSAVVFTDSQKLAENILVKLKVQVEQLTRSEETTKCLQNYGAIVVFETLEEVVIQANYFAPEHMEIQCGDKSKEIADKIENTGAIFIGDYSPVAVGDYWAGPSHTLPTGCSARFTSALSANDFVKATSIIEYSEKQLAKAADDIVRLAMTEGLDAHAKSVQIRQQKS